MIKEQIILAKSDGTTLIDHSLLVKHEVELVVLETITSAFLEKSIYVKQYIKDLPMAALFHDIGKATAFFQKKLIDQNDSFEDFEIKSLKFRHNEISYAFLATWTNLSNEALKLIYWHHGISKNEVCGNTLYDILEHVTSEDIDTMKLVVKKLAPEILLDSPNNGFIKSPPYYVAGEIENNAKFITALSCLITADRRASGLTRSIDDFICKQVISEFNSPYSGERFDKQVEITELTGKTSIINAPAGFGKTLVGLLWSMKSNKKLIWVCPRNEVANSVYDSVLKELKLFNSPLSVELYHGGEVQLSTNPFANFNSDIIITNIDNFLKPSYENDSTYKNISILNCDVIFDEYHELINDAPLFSLLCSLLKLRHSITKSKTILLSASPIDFTSLWGDDSVVYLPKKHGHYKAAHDKLYLFNFTVDKEIETIKNNSIYILNSISGSQELAVKLSHENLIHSKFTNEDRLNIMGNIYSNYGKSGDRGKVNKGYIGTHIVQASLDVSFNELYEDVLSPMSTVQRGGRLDRFGDNKTNNVMTINKSTSRRNESVVKILFDINLNNEWYYYLKSNISKPITLDELYILYNDFMLKYELQITKFIRSKFGNSMDGLTKIFPKKYLGVKSNSKNKNLTAGSNKLRSVGNEIFYMCEDDNSNFIGPFSTPIYEYSKIHVQFNEDASSHKKIIKIVNGLIDKPNGIFDYSGLKKYEYTKSKGVSIDIIRDLAKNSKTPYPAVNFAYSKILGVHSKNINNDDLIID